MPELPEVEVLRRTIEANVPHDLDVHLIMDNLNLHGPNALIRTLGVTQGAALWARFTPHYTPKHGSWLTMAEIELSIMGRPCVHRRIPTESTLGSAAASWEQRRHSRHATIKWRFTKTDARRIFKYHKPTLSTPNRERFDKDGKPLPQTDEGR